MHLPWMNGELEQCKGAIFVWNNKLHFDTTPGSENAMQDVQPCNLQVINFNVNPQANVLSYRRIDYARQTT